MKKILILSANPRNTGLLRLDEEMRSIQSALERSRSREQFELISRGAVRIDDLRRVLLDNEPQVVHFSGHGTGTDGIVLENIAGEVQLVSTESLSNLFKLFKEKVECVLLNACYSETQAETIHHHIDCVIGMERAVTDKAAINFSTAFYDALGAGRTYAESFQFGRNNIELHGIPESLTPKIKIRNNSKTLFSNKQLKSNMTGNRNIHIGSGNYNERIEGDYIQGNYNENANQSRSFTVGNVRGDFKPIGSAMMSDNVEISGTVAESINQLPSSPDHTKLGIKELLSQLTEAISTSSNLNDEDRTEVLEQVKVLTEAGKNPNDGAMRKVARTAVKILQGTVSGLPDVAKLAEACSKLLPLITKFFGL